MSAPLSSPTTATAAAAISSSSDMSAASSARSVSTNCNCNWASLPDDLVRLLASRLLAADVMDYVRFRAVCAAWRSCTASPRGRGVVDPRFHPSRWMMLPEGYGLYPGHPKLHGYVRFFNLDTGAFVRVHIPLFEDHCVLDSVEGLLVLQRDDDTGIRLLHPFTGDILDLPPLSTLLPQVMYPSRVLGGLPARKKIRYFRSFTTAATFAADGVVTVMLAFRYTSRVAFATSLDHQWTMSTWVHDFGETPCFSYNGKVYMVYRKLNEATIKIIQIDTPLPGEGLQPPKVIAAPTCKVFGPIYIVECNSEVMVICHSDKHGPQMLLIYKLSDLMIEGYTPVPLASIGDDKVIFMQERTIVVSAKVSPMLQGGTIIYRRHRMPGPLRKYHIGSGSWSPGTDPCSLDGKEPGPCSIIQHIYTCCRTTYW